MPNKLITDWISEQIRSVNRRLSETQADPRNSDRALWGAMAVLSFAGITGQSQDVQTEPETVLSDLLGDLMHWCNVQKTSSLEQPIDFESALERARNYYNEECADEGNQLRV
jgi:hypothetical protein